MCAYVVSFDGVTRRCLFYCWGGELTCGEAFFEKGDYVDCLGEFVWFKKGCGKRLFKQAVGGYYGFLRLLFKGRGWIGNVWLWSGGAHPASGKTLKFCSGACMVASRFVCFLFGGERWRVESCLEGHQADVNVSVELLVATV